jgi:hypothetical protein
MISRVHNNRELFAGKQAGIAKSLCFSICESFSWHCGEKENGRDFVMCEASAIRTVRVVFDIKKERRDCYCKSQQPRRCVML